MNPVKFEELLSLITLWMIAQCFSSPQPTSELKQKVPVACFSQLCYLVFSVSCTLGLVLRYPRELNEMQSGIA